MKKPFILIGAFLLTVAFSTLSNAQGSVPCVETLNKFFHKEVVTTMPQGAAPKVLNKLGTNPQFGRISRHTAASAYSHLKSVKRRGKRQAAELDRLLRTLGYTGANDPDFDASDITPVIVPKGAVGWMGSGSTKYFKAKFGKDFEGYQIFVKNGPCFVYIMKTCGNIFYQDIPPCDQNIPCPECNNFSSWSANNKANPYCNCVPCLDCQEAVQQSINLSGDGKIASGDYLKDTKEVELVASYGGQSLCLGKLSVPVNVAYEYAASGSTSASEKVSIDNQNGNVLSAIDLKIPVNLDFNLEKGQTSFGSDGAIRMDVTKKRFKVLKKSYPVCATDMASETMEGLSAPEIDKADAETMDGSSDGVIGKKKQTLFFAGNDAISEVVSKEHNPTVTVIAHATKAGKLAKGESADKYLCLGQYGVAGASALQYMLTGSSNLTHAVEICDDKGNQPSERNINLPIDLKANFTKQEMKVGDDGKVYIQITEKQYKKMGKRFSRCCSNGDDSCF